MRFEDLPADRFSDLMIQGVVGAYFVVGDFFATKENGWGRVLDTLV
jgi:hypothetical protein